MTTLQWAGLGVASWPVVAHGDLVYLKLVSHRRAVEEALKGPTWNLEHHRRDRE